MLSAGCESCLTKITYFVLLLILPVLGLVWNFITKSPMHFMYTCFGISSLWVAFGVGCYLCTCSESKKGKSK